MTRTMYPRPFWPKARSPWVKKECDRCHLKRFMPLRARYCGGCRLWSARRGTV